MLDVKRAVHTPLTPLFQAAQPKVTIVCLSVLVTLLVQGSQSGANYPKVGPRSIATGPRNHVLHGTVHEGLDIELTGCPRGRS